MIFQKTDPGMKSNLRFNIYMRMYILACTPTWRIYLYAKNTRTWQLVLICRILYANNFSRIISRKTVCHSVRQNCSRIKHKKCVPFLTRTELAGKFVYLYAKCIREHSWRIKYWYSCYTRDLEKYIREHSWRIQLWYC